MLYSLALTLALSPSTPLLLPSMPFAGGRLYTSLTLHVGVRPAAYADPYEHAVGATLQISWF